MVLKWAVPVHRVHREVKTERNRKENAEEVSGGRMEDRVVIRMMVDDGKELKFSILNSAVRHAHCSASGIFRKSVNIRNLTAREV